MISSGGAGGGRGSWVGNDEIVSVVCVPPLANHRSTSGDAWGGASTVPASSLDRRSHRGNCRDLAVPMLSFFIYFFLPKKYRGWRKQKSKANNFEIRSN